VICIELPSLHRELREMRARDHADQLATERDYGDVDCGIDQLVVNTLRHEYTNYDADQSADRDTAANRAIADRCPWLAAECGRHIERRTTHDRVAAAQLADYLAEQEKIAHARRETVSASRAVCGSFHIGGSVEVIIKGHHRSGTIVKVHACTVTVP
jgi:hypothetical protein